MKIDLNSSRIELIIYRHNIKCNNLRYRLLQGKLKPESECYRSRHVFKKRRWRTLSHVSFVNMYVSNLHTSTQSFIYNTSNMSLNDRSERTDNLNCL